MLFRKMNEPMTPHCKSAKPTTLHPRARRVRPLQLRRSSESPVSCASWGARRVMGEVREGCTNLPNTQSQRSCDSDDLRSCDSLTELGGFGQSWEHFTAGDWGGNRKRFFPFCVAFRSLSLSLQDWASLSTGLGGGRVLCAHEPVVGIVDSPKSLPRSWNYRQSTRLQPL